MFAALAVASATPSTRSVPTTSAGSATPQMLELTLVETGGKTKERIRMRVPIGGELAAWVRGGDEQQFCRVHVHRTPRAGEVRVDLECARHPKNPPDLEIKAERTFPSHRTVLLGEIARADGGTVEVRASLK
jgi:hypothetical protein